MIFLSALLLAIGIVSGLVFALLLVFLWIAVAGPIQEWIAERTVDKFDRKKHGGVRGQPEPADDGMVSILISDVHIDTWDFEKSDKPRAFLEFLTWVRDNPRVTDLYINGDILDMPPHPLNQRDVPTITIDPQGDPRYPDLDPKKPLGVLQENFDSTLLFLNELVKRDNTLPLLRITYLTGNHDIGIAGLRFIRPDLNWSSFRVAWNPAVRLRMTEDRWLYIEHGHRYDPFLWVYMRYALLELLRGPGTAVAQRGGKTGMTKRATLDTETEGKPTSQGWEDQREEIKPASQDGIPANLARYRYRQAARALFRKLQKTDPQIKVVTFGHTHIPDRYEFAGGRTYINSGDWAGNDTHQCYLIIHPNGCVTGPHQWRGPAQGNRCLKHGYRDGAEPVGGYAATPV
jgi:UDP-2,3-diacylglucosamine pyrophosphatase LpxH